MTTGRINQGYQPNFIRVSFHIFLRRKCHHQMTRQISSSTHSKQFFSRSSPSSTNAYSLPLYAIVTHQETILPSSEDTSFHHTSPLCKTQIQICIFSRQTSSPVRRVSARASVTTGSSMYQGASQAYQRKESVVLQFLPLITFVEMCRKSVQRANVCSLPTVLNVQKSPNTRV